MSSVYARPGDAPARIWPWALALAAGFVLVLGGRALSDRGQPQECSGSHDGGGNGSKYGFRVVVEGATHTSCGVATDVLLAVLRSGVPDETSEANAGRRVELRSGSPFAGFRCFASVHQANDFGIDCHRGDDVVVGRTGSF